MWQRHIYRCYQKALRVGHIYKCVTAQRAKMCLHGCGEDTFTGVTKKRRGLVVVVISFFIWFLRYKWGACNQ